MAGMGLSGGFAAGAGADALEDVLKRAFLEQTERRRAKQEDRRIGQDDVRLAQENRRLTMADADRDAARADLAQSRAETGALKLSGTLKAGQRGIDPSTVARLTAGGLGDTVTAAPLSSRNIGQGMASTANPSLGNTYEGTASQQDDAAQNAELQRQITLASPKLRGTLQMVGTLPQDKRAGAMTEVMREQAKPTNQPVMRVNPRTGTMEQVGEAPAGAHFVNEPAPRQPPQDHFSTQVVTGADGKTQQLVRINTQTGAVSPVELGAGVMPGKPTPATENQTNLAIYASRLDQAAPTLDKLQTSIQHMNPANFEVQTFFDKPYLQSKEMQAYQQAARMFINSTLRRESGAAISPTEFAEARKQYLPMPNDGPDVLAMKAAARADVAAQFKKGAGAAGQGGTTPAGPKVVRYDMNGNQIKD